MFFLGGDNPSLNMMNASFTEEDTLCGKGLCVSTGKHVLRGGWWDNFLQLLAICRSLVGFSGCSWSQTGLVSEEEERVHQCWETLG